MKSLDQFFQNEIVHALGWTILHSIWQGLLIVILLTLALVLLRKHSSRIRYFVGYLALLSLALCSVVTFFFSLPATPLNAMGAIGESAVINNAVIPLAELAVPLVEEGTYWQSVLHFFELNLPWITIIWMMGVLILSLRFLAELAFVQRLKHQPGGKVAGAQQDLLNQMAASMGIQKIIELKENLRIDGPMVIGFIKPVILVPIGLLSRLDTTQVESILAHELAHIKRHDYIFNMLQSLVEILLFFNPATWWISALIRSEREHACDEMAIAHTGNQLVFVQTLAKLEEYRRFPNNMAMAFNGRRNAGVLGRIQRIVNSEAQFRLPFKLFWSAVILLGSVGLFAFQAQPIATQDPFTVLESDMQEQPQEGLSETLRTVETDSLVQPTMAPTQNPTLVSTVATDKKEATSNISETITKENSPTVFSSETLNLNEADTVPDKIKQLRREMFELEKGFREQEMALQQQTRNIQKKMLQAEREIQSMENNQMKAFYELEKKSQEMQFNRNMKLKELELEHNTIESKAMELQYEAQEMESKMQKADNEEELRKKQKEILQQMRELQKRKKEIELNNQRHQVEVEKEMQLIQNEQWKLKEGIKLDQNDKRLEVLELEQQMQEIQFKRQMIESEKQSKLQLLQMQVEEEMMKWEEKKERQ